MKFNVPQLRQQAAQRVSAQEPHAKKVLGYYVLAFGGLSLLINLLTLMITNATEGMVTLTQVNFRTGLTALNSVITTVAGIVSYLLNAGHSGVALEIARGNEPQPRHLTWAFSYVWKILLCGLRMVLWMFLFVYGFTIVASGILTTQLLAVPGALSGQPDMEAITPLVMNMVIGIVIATLAVYLFLMIRRRLYFFYLYDHSNMPAGQLPKASIRLLKGSCWQFFRIDLSYWWFYLLMLLCSCLSVVPMFLPEQLPISSNVVMLLTSVISIALNCLVLYVGKNRIWVTYALAYDQLLKAQEESTQLPAETQGNNQV